MARLPKLLRLDRLEIRKGIAAPDKASRKGKGAPKLEIKLGDREHPQFSPEKDRLELDRGTTKEEEATAKRNRALGLIEKFRLAERMETAQRREREWDAERMAEEKRAEEFALKFKRGARLAKIVLRFVVALAMIYFGVRGIVTLIDLWLHPPARGANWGRFIPSVWGGLLYMGLGFALRWIRAKLAKYEEDFIWMPYLRISILTWIAFCGLLSFAAFNGLFNPAEPPQGVLFLAVYVTLCVCCGFFFTH